MVPQNTPDIDFVLIWVDGSDPRWQEEKSRYREDGGKFNLNNVRYRDWGLLHYWFRSVERYAPWVRRIHFVTCGQVPDWMQTEHPKLHLVEHRDYMDEEYLPTFSSHPIELNIHRIQGLSEQFVYFNDDVYLTSPVKPEDFFVNGIPRGCAVLNPPTANRHGVACVAMNDLGIIADHFDFVTQFKKNFRKYLHPVYGMKNLRTLLLLPWHRYVGFYDLHLSMPFLKSTFQQVWQQEEALLREVSSHRFRSDSDVNQWLMNYWQLASGNFVPVSPKIGHCFDIVSDRDLDQVIQVIENQSMKVICINDTEKIENYEQMGHRLQKAFDIHLREKSSFEK